MLNRFIAIPALIVLLSACGGEGSSVSSVQTISQQKTANIKVYHLAEMLEDTSSTGLSPVDIAVSVDENSPETLFEASRFGYADSVKVELDSDVKRMTFLLRDQNTLETLASVDSAVLEAGHEYYLFVLGQRSAENLRLKLTEKPAPVAKEKTESVFRVANFNTGEKTDLYIDGTRAQQDLEPDTLSEPVVLNKMDSIITSFVKPGGDASADEIKRCEYGHKFTESDGIAVYDPTGLCRNLLP